MNFREAVGNSRKIDPARRQQLLEFCKNLNLHFKNLNLLDLAFHHRSFSNESVDHRRINNERLEFLGDSVLGLATASFLYEDMMDYPEGDLAKIKANVVSEKSLAPIALNIMHIDRYLVMGKGEDNSGGRKKPAILADACEAVIGALYLDSGFEEAEKFVLRLIVPEIRKVQEDVGNKDYKSILQEAYQKSHKSCPVYKLEKKTGPDHDQTFYVSVLLGSVKYGPCTGKSKKSAEQEAARMALNALGL